MTMEEIIKQHNRCNSRRGEHGGLGSAYHGVIVQDMQIQPDRHADGRLQAVISAELPFTDISASDLYKWILNAFFGAYGALLGHCPYDFASGVMVNGCIVRLAGLATGKKGFLLLTISVSMTQNCPLWDMSKEDVQALLDSLAKKC